MKLITPEIDIDPKDPFKNDCLTRKPFAESLTNLITRVEDNLVISLDAQWGDGKTTFVKMWQAFLEQNDIKCIYFDAFKNDFFDDPFVALVGNITSLLEKTRTKKAKINDLKKKASKIGVQLLSLGARVGIKAATLGTIQDSEINKAKDIISNTSAFASKIIEEKLNTYKEDIDAIEEFRNKLSELAQEAFKEKNKPLVFIVDELDRCKPTYALELLEKIKHLFSVNNIVFVLVMHTQQLEESIKCIYGPNIDARTYLQKFINIGCKLPKNDKDIHENDYKKYCNALNKLHRIQQPVNRTVPTILETLAKGFNFSLRDLQHCYTYLVLLIANKSANLFWDYRLFSLIVLLKLKKQDIFEELRAGESSYDELWNRIKLEELFSLHADRINIDHLKESLRMCLLNDKEFQSLDQETHERKMYNSIEYKYNIERDEIIPSICNQIELFRFAGSEG